MKVAVLGIGSVRCAPPVIASLGSYFGERPLEIFFWDSDSERLDLFDRFARLCFQMTRAGHSLHATEDSEEAMQEATAVMLAVGENCARKFLKGRSSLLGHGETDSILVRRCVSELLTGAVLEASILSLIEVDPDGHPWTQVAWPPSLTEGERRAVPHQILRFLNGDDYPHRLLKQFESSPVTQWLDELIAKGD